MGAQLPAAGSILLTLDSSALPGSVIALGTNRAVEGSCSPGAGPKSGQLPRAAPPGLREALVGWGSGGAQFPQLKNDHKTNSDPEGKLVRNLEWWLMI